MTRAGAGVGSSRTRIARRLAFTGVTLAVIAAIGAVSAGFGSRLGIWHFRSGFAILRWSAALAAFSLLPAFAAAILSSRDRNWRNLGIALFSFAVGAVVFAVPVSWRIAANKVPPIHDISTDTARPPQFVAILPLRSNAPNPPEYGGDAVADQQRVAYPEIRTLILELPALQAFQKAVRTARDLGWKVVAEVPVEGRIEASDTTFWFGFTDDIVIRITPAGYRSLVDVRSVSRVGKGDTGTNAARIRKFLRRIRPQE